MELEELSSFGLFGRSFLGISSRSHGELEVGVSVFPPCASLSTLGDDSYTHHMDGWMDVSKFLP